MKNWLLWLFLGIISIIGGFLAIANPLEATITAVHLAGWTFLVVGCLQIFTAFHAEGFGATLWAILGGAAGIFVGISLFNNPFAGAITLTVLVGVLFFIGGITKIFMSFSLRGSPFFMPVMVSGALSLLLGFMILSNFPGSAVISLGVMLAVELISNGVAMISLSMQRKAEDQ
ncbi:MAG: DUF308 domain-containing protein [Proteobacteria bacterium]|nr:DUF308 domain-containing protein [Pseudomonadota bacterium]